jgi:capsular exopolysaccharide synthesis family protein
MDNEQTVPGENANQADLNLRHYWHVVLERRWLVISAFVSVFVLCLIYLFRATPIFRASTRLQIDRESVNFANVRDVFGADARDQDYLQTQFQNLRARSLLEKVINKLELAKDPHYMRSADKVQALALSMTVSPLRLTRLVDIHVEHPKPDRAEIIADTIASEFIQRNLDQKKTRLTGALSFLQDESTRLGTNVTQAEEGLRKFREKNKMSSLAEDQNVVLQAYKVAQAAYDFDLSVAEKERDVATKVRLAIQEGLSPDSIPQVINLPGMSDLRRQLTALEAQLVRLTNNFGPKHPSVMGIVGEIERYQGDIKKAAAEQVKSLYLAVELAQTKMQSSSNLLAKKQLELNELNRLKIDYEMLQREVDRKKELYSFVVKSFQETQLSQNDTTQNIRVVDRAYTKPRAVKPPKMLTLVLGVVGGLGVGVGLAFFVNYLDDSIKSQDDVETYLRLPFLGYVPNIKTNSVIERDLQAHTQPQSSAAEGFRTVRAAISLAPRAEKQRVFAVTSTIPSEGKSLVASNLAIVLAQTGLKTLLVDADLRRPSVHKAYELQSPAGLTSYLQEKTTSLDEITHTTEIPNLDVICCGAVPTNPSELVGSRRMGQFLDEVRKRYDRVVLDCPPVSAVSDPLVIASMSDGVVFVTKFNRIRREHARKSVQRIQDAGVRITGVVLNDIDFEGKDSYYYSYYYYQNRYYASYRSESKDAGAPGKKS